MRESNRFDTRLKQGATMGHDLSMGKGKTSPNSEVISSSKVAANPCGHELEKRGKSTPQDRDRQTYRVLRRASSPSKLDMAR